jgi:uncharacterized protein YbaA (DUF1428 family)
MYTSVYLFRVPNEHVIEFIRIQKEAAAIYLSYGSLREETLIANDLQAKYGCIGFDNILPNTPSETVFIASSTFNDKHHHDTCMERIDADVRILELYDALKNIIAIESVVRGEFEGIV